LAAENFMESETLKYFFRYNILWEKNYKPVPLTESYTPYHPETTGTY